MKYELNSLIGNITEADCEEVLAQLPDKCVDLVLADPPYGIGAASKQFTRANKQTGKSLAPCRDYGHSDWDAATPGANFFSTIKRIGQNQIVWGGNYFAAYLGNSSCWLVWDKQNGDNLYADCELAWASFPSAVRRFAYTWHGFIQGNMGAAKEERYHPTQKPLPLYMWCISRYTKPGDLVLDPMSGSGTAALACHALGRRFICIEREHQYVEVSRNRLRDAQAQMSLFPNGAKTENCGSAENSIQQPQYASLKAGQRTCGKR
jgi:DNA modification methylase